MGEAGNWCLIESDPGVFTEMLSGFGCKGLQVEEMYTLEDEEFAKLRPVHGLIFLFKWQAGDTSSGTPAPDSDVFFAQQVIQNACATQALVNLVLNLEHADVEMGKTLSEFKTFCTEFDPASRGLCLSNSEEIRTVHNSFARQQLFELDIKTGKEEDNFHFVCYVPVRGRVYELDGLVEYPMEVGSIADGQDWLEVVRPAIQQRILKYSQGEIRFNLMAVVTDRRKKYISRLEEIAASGMETEDVAAEICELQNMIEEEEQKARRHRNENSRRRFNYLPFIIELLRKLAKDGKLVGLTEQAVERSKSKREEAKKLEAKA